MVATKTDSKGILVKKKAERKIGIIAPPKLMVIGRVKAFFGCFIIPPLYSFGHHPLPFFYSCMLNGYTVYSHYFYLLNVGLPVNT